MKRGVPVHTGRRPAIIRLAEEYACNYVSSITSGKSRQLFIRCRSIRAPIAPVCLPSFRISSGVVPIYKPKSFPAPSPAAVIQETNTPSLPRRTYYPPAVRFWEDSTIGRVFGLHCSTGHLLT